MSVPETIQWAVRIAFFIGMRMMLNVRGCPAYGGTLEGHAAADDKKSANPRMRGKSLMGEHAVVPDGDAKTAESIQDSKEHKIPDEDVLIPEKNRCGNGSEERNRDQSEYQQFMKIFRAVHHHNTRSLRRV